LKGYTAKVSAGFAYSVSGAGASESLPAGLVLTGVSAKADFS
jgi:hypothetical protein